MSKKTKSIKAPAIEKKTTEKKEKKFPVRFILILSVLLIYGNSVNFSFTLDDDLFYLKHKSVQQGFSAIGDIFTKGSLNQFDGSTGTQPFRPLTLTFFAFQKVFFDNSASAAHLMNILLYVLLALLLHKLLLKLIPGINELMAGLICLLFLVYPLHTEVVSSVKSVDELLAALFGFMAWNEFLKEDKTKWRIWITGSLFFFLAVLSKESAIAFLAIIPLSMVMLRNKKLSDALLGMLPLAFFAFVFLWMRHSALGVGNSSDQQIIMNNVLYGAKDLAELTATKAEILLYYLRLTIWPWPLSYDYAYNQIPLVGWGDIRAIAGLSLYAALFVLAIYNFKRQPLLAFCILFFFISSSPTNNLFFINGATVGERFLFVPSLAICILIPYLLSKALKLEWKNLSFHSGSRFFGVMFLLTLVFGSMSYLRSQDWKDGLTLFLQGVEQSPNSARAHYNLASQYMDSARHTEDPAVAAEFLQNAVSYFKSSLKIYPEYAQALYNSGLCYTLIKDSAKAIEAYRRTIAADPKYIPAINNLGVIYQSRRNLDSTRYYYEMAYRLNTKAPIAIKNLADLYFFVALDFYNKGKADSALHYYHRSLSFNNSNIYIYNNLGSVFSGLKQYDSSLYYLQKGYALDNATLMTQEKLMILENLGAVNLQCKRYSDAIAYAGKAYALQPGSKKALGILRDAHAAAGNQAEADRFGSLFNAIR